MYLYLLILRTLTILSRLILAFCSVLASPCCLLNQCHGSPPGLYWHILVWFSAPGKQLLGMVHADLSNVSAKVTVIFNLIMVPVTVITDTVSLVLCFIVPVTLDTVNNTDVAITYHDTFSVTFNTITLTTRLHLSTPSL